VQAHPAAPLSATTINSATLQGSSQPPAAPRKQPPAASIWSPPALTRNQAQVTPQTVARGLFRPIPPPPPGAPPGGTGTTAPAPSDPPG
jgi:hypothetical protein